MSLSLETIIIIKKTAPDVTKNVLQISQRMYELLFTKHPELEKLFQGDPVEQHKKLAVALSLYTVNIDSLGMLQELIRKMVSTHTKAHVLAEYYPYVGEALLAAIKDVLTDVATEEVLNAWAEAYEHLSHALIEKEKLIYAKSPKR